MVGLYGSGTVYLIVEFELVYICRFIPFVWNVLTAGYFETSVLGVSLIFLMPCLLLALRIFERSIYLILL